MWQPWVGHWLHLRPEDMGDLTLEQYVAAHRWVKDNADG